LTSTNVQILTAVCLCGKMLSDMLTITCLTSTNVQILTAVCLCGKMLSDMTYNHLLD
jgi:hypothetical protein